MFVSPWQIPIFTDFSHLQYDCQFYSSFDSTPCLCLCLTGSVKKVAHVKTWRKKKKKQQHDFGDEQIPYWYSATASENAVGCLEIAFLNAMGFGSFNHVMNIYFFSIYLLLVEVVMDFSTDAPVHVYFLIAPVSIVIWQCKTVMFGLIHIGNPSFKDFHLSPSSPLRSSRTGNDRMIGFIYILVYFLWMAAWENTIFQDKNNKTVMIANGRI